MERGHMVVNYFFLRTTSFSAQLLQLWAEKVFKIDPASGKGLGL